MRLPAAVLEALGLKKGDEVEVAVERRLRVQRDAGREEVLAMLLSHTRPAPPGFRSSIKSENARGRYAEEP